MTNTTRSELRNQEELHFLQGGGEMGKLIRQHDWSTTSLGHPQNWPKSLQTSIGVMLCSPYPMFVWWGREMIMFHNDDYVPVLGKRHPEALGKSGPEIWADVWEFIGPLMYDVLDHGKSCYFERQLLIPERKGFKEETYFTFSFSPIPDDNAGVGGIFCVCSEDTRQVLSQRRLATLSQLSELTASENTREVFKKSSEILSANQNDMPFGLFYRLTEDSKAATLEGAFGVDAGASLSPAVIQAEGNDQQAWPIFNTKVTPGKPFLIDDLAQRFSSLPVAHPWEESPSQAIIIPMQKSDQEQLFGFFISGISPRLEFDDDYRSFLSLVGGQVSTAIAKVSAHEEERIRTEKLIALNKAKTDFFNNVSHEFRTPITLMLGPLEEILSEWGNTMTQKDIDRLTTIHQNTLRLLKMVNSLLDFSRIEANKAQASFQPIDLCQYTSELAGTFQSAIKKAGLIYEIECSPVSEPVYVDPQLWEKIILNLLSNALKFTIEGKIKIELAETETSARLSIKDTGVGIPEKELPNLFKRFHRIENTRSRSHEGTGIGLALVKELVELHGGKIEVQSIEGKGTTFTINIPKGKTHLDNNKIREDKEIKTSDHTAEAFVLEAMLWTANDDGPNAGAIQTGKQESKPQEDDTITILLVDDNADMRNYLTRVLGSLWNVITAKDGLEALELVKQSMPDLIVSDIMMPRMDGFAMLEQIRKDHRISNIPVILLSARAGEEATVEGLEKGANDYLVKPFSSRELIARVKTQLELNDTKALAEKLEKLVGERTQELQRSNQDLEQFAHVVSHDLKEPARKVKLFGSRLIEEAGEQLPNKAKDYLQKIENAAERMSVLIDGVLQYSSSSAAELKINRINLSEVMDSVESDLEIVIQQKGATIQYEELLEINGSEVLIHQLFYNLVNNSLKFAKPGFPPHIYITSGTADQAEVIKQGLAEDKEYVRICIQDNGIGFMQTQAENIFKSFTRLNPKDQYEGTGLGLALCKKIAERHKGTIYAEGKEGEGASFIILLPKD